MVFKAKNHMAWVGVVVATFLVFFVVFSIVKFCLKHLIPRLVGACVGSCVLPLIAFIIFGLILKKKVEATVSGKEENSGQEATDGDEPGGGTQDPGLDSAAVYIFMSIPLGYCLGCIFGKSIYKLILAFVTSVIGSKFTCAGILLMKFKIPTDMKKMPKF